MSVIKTGLTQASSCQAVGIIYDILQLVAFLEWAGMLTSSIAMFFHAYDTSMHRKLYLQCVSGS